MFELETLVPVSCCRLVRYDEYLDSLERSYEGEEDMSIGNVLGGVKATYNFDLLLETRQSHQVFQPYKPGGT
jgi:ubiquitin carboxyl-terminal hydrolase 47